MAIVRTLCDRVHKHSVESHKCIQVAMCATSLDVARRRRSTSSTSTHDCVIDFYTGERGFDMQPFSSKCFWPRLDQRLAQLGFLIWKNIMHAT